DAGEVRRLLEGKVGQIEAVAEAMEGSVEVGAGVGDHVDAADLELGSFRVVAAGLLAGQVVGDHGPGESRVGDHSRLDGMGEVDQSGHAGRVEGHTRPRGGPLKVRQMRLVVEADDLEAAEAFYRDVLGLEESLVVDGKGGARVVVLEAGRATLELVNPEQRRLIDQLEVGREVSGSIRVAFEVDDASGYTDRLASAGAELVAGPVETPWHSLNSRLEAPAGLQITIFEQLEPE